ncbi:hypothetical protein V5O48_015794 [Marasmius crinis-equi]|uniref:Uncharacterized protein n=1 Tax=Marasmius crinis-equi TaxID=585013 RepID=A0ABR3ETM4_9AGAR
MRKTEPPPPPPTVQPTRRSVSTRLSSRTTAPRTSSVIIHEADEEHDSGNTTEATGEVTREEPSIQVEEPQPLLLPRTRKAKDTQRRLGMGRPVAAGGSGARAVTKSLSVSKSRRGKVSRSIIPVEATIPEEEPEVPKEAEQQSLEPTQPDDPPSTQLGIEIDTMSDARQEVEQKVNEALKPIVRQLESLKLEIEQYKSVQHNVSQLQTQVTELCECKEKVVSLTAEVAELRKKANGFDSLQMEVRDLKETLSRLYRTETRSPNETELASGFKTPTNIEPNAGPSRQLPTDNSALPHPGIAPVLLGKRHRDSTVSNITDVVEEGQEDDLSADELATKVIRPNRKRARTSTSGDAAGSTVTKEEPEEVHQPGFIVYNDRQGADSSFADPPPPTTPLPRAYRAYSPSAEAGPSSTPENPAENHPFAFSFLAVPPTPHPGSFSMHNFPYPEPPQSPTPGSNDVVRNPGRSGEPQDIFQSFGLPPIGRPRNLLTPAPRTSSQDARNFVNPAALTTQEPDGESRDRGTRVSDLDDLRSLESGNDDSRRTMYGTELETDTRFGDFGVEGVASGFWTGSGTRF